MTTLEQALLKWEAAKRGETPVISDAILDALSVHFETPEMADTSEASYYFGASVTVHNPNRVGLLDAYLLSAPVQANHKEVEQA